MVFRDVTMERRTQDALVAQEKLAVAGRLAATIAHEINNPLGSVLDMLYLMRNGVSEDESKQYMQMAEAELTRVGADCSRDAWAVSRVAGAHRRWTWGRRCRTYFCSWNADLRNWVFTCTTDLPPDICIMGFPAELRQVFTNLVTNAVEAAGRGGELRVSVALGGDAADQRRARPGQGRCRHNQRQRPGDRRSVCCHSCSSHFLRPRGSAAQDSGYG